MFELNKYSFSVTSSSQIDVQKLLDTLTYADPVAIAVIDDKAYVVIHQQVLQKVTKATDEFIFMARFEKLIDAGMEDPRGFVTTVDRIPKILQLVKDIKDASFKLEYRDGGKVTVKTYKV